ncbi:MAG TPA: TonB-dependent receptor [Flavitalea sp.]|nr:TonB-dependent receptor [Flavitalea sp.]
MKNFVRQKTAFYLICQFSILSLFAQDTANIRSLDEVVITANKYPTKSSSTGKVLSVITRRQIEQAGGKDLSQLLNEQTGIYINSANSNHGKDKTVFVRGGKAEHTLILIDGVPVYDASGIGSNFDIRQIPLEQVERVEILKGSQSTLYGSDAIAGVINIITKKSAQGKYTTVGKLSYGSFNTLRANASVSAATNTLDYQAGYGFSRTDGINETLDAPGNSTAGDKDGFHQHHINGTLRWKATEQVNISPYIRFTKLQADLDQGAFTDEADYSSTLDNLQTGIRSVIDIKKIRLNLLYNYNHIKRTYLDDSVKSRNGFAIFSEGHYNSSEHFADLYLNIPVRDRIKVTTGIDYRTSSTDQSIFSVSSFGPYKNVFDKDSAHHRQVAVYGNALLTNEKGFSLEAGGRWNNHNGYGSFMVYNINPSVLISERLKVFTNISSGYRTPGLYQLYSEFGNHNLEPEKATTFEGGLQFFTKNDQVTARLTYFQRSVTDVIAFIFNPATSSSQYVNQDQQDDQGFEAEAGLRLNNQLTIKANYTYVDGKLTTDNNGKDTTFFNLFRRPKNTMGINIGWEASKKFFISTQFQSYGKTFDQVYDASFNLVNVEIKKYLLWDVYAEYRAGEKFRFFADLRNLGNGTYQEVYGYRSPGFNAYGGIRFNF